MSEISKLHGQSRDLCNIFLKLVNITGKIAVNLLIVYRKVEMGVKDQKQPCHKLSCLTECKSFSRTYLELDSTWYIINSKILVNRCKILKDLSRFAINFSLWRLYTVYLLTKLFCDEDLRVSSEHSCALNLKVCLIAEMSYAVLKSGLLIP